jgi:Bcr/CflA subfamily drug resistance transporter
MNTQSNKNIAFTICILLITIGQTAWFMSLPSLPYIMTAMQSSSRSIQLTTAMFCLGMGPMQFIYGPLSDYYGRKPIVIGGIILFSLASLGVTLTNSMQGFLFARLMQGVGVAACSTMGRVIPRDLYTGSLYAKKSAQLSMALSAMPLLAPIMGGYLQYYFNWRASFMVMLMYSIAILFLVIMMYRETNPFLRQQAFTIKHFFLNYKKILSDRVFISYLLIGAATLSAEIIFNVVAPFLLQTNMGLTSIEYGWAILTIACGFFIGAYIASRLADYYSTHHLVRNGLISLLLSSVILLSCSLMGHTSLIIIITTMFIFTFGTGFVYPNAAVGAMQPFAKTAGAAGALLGGLQLFFAGIANAMILQLQLASLTSLAVMLMILSIISIILLFNFIWPRSIKITEKSLSPSENI